MVLSEALQEQPIFIGGQWVTTNQLATIRLPYDGTEIATVYQADEDCLSRAIESAAKGQRVMAAMSNGERSDLLFRIRDLVKRDAAGLADLLCKETGKPIREARLEVERAQQTLLESAIVARELSGEVIPIDAVAAGKGRLAMTIREPVGVIGAITPFNVPLNLALHKMGPAFAGGNAVVHKPSENTPLSALRLARIVEEAGAPDGAYNVVTGGGELGQKLVTDPRVHMITFTGSVAVGKWIRSHAGLKRVTLELGGNCAVLVEPDADLPFAAERCAAGAFALSGQVCISVQRIFAHRSVHDRFVDLLKRETEKLRIGHPLSESTDIASLIDEEAAVRVEQWINDAVQGGAVKITGGERRRATITPAILTKVPAQARLSCAEAFGPVVAVYDYEDRLEVIERINNTNYGLQAGVFTRDLPFAFEAAKRIAVGGVLINDIPSTRADNMPYGGVKESGVGREGPRYAVQEMTESKLICWR